MGDKIVLNELVNYKILKYFLFNFLKPIIMDAKTLNQIIQKLGEELKILNSKSENLLIHYEKAAGICWAALNDLRKLVIKQGFRDIK